MKTECLESAVAVYIKNIINAISRKNLGDGFHTQNILKNIQVSYVKNIAGFFVLKSK